MEDIGKVIAEYKDILENADYDDLSIEEFIKDFIVILQEVQRNRTIEVSELSEFLDVGQFSGGKEILFDTEQLPDYENAKAKVKVLYKFGEDSNKWTFSAIRKVELTDKYLILQRENERCVYVDLEEVAHFVIDKE